MATSQPAEILETELPLLGLLWYASMAEAITHKQLVKGLLLANSLVVIYGESNSGKSFWILDLALCIASGKPWRGRRVEKGLVVYVPLEGVVPLRNRVSAYRKSNADLLAGIPFAIIPQSQNLLDRTAVAVLIATIRAAEVECGEKVVLVIFDTLARALAGADENSSQDMGAAVCAADLIRAETGATVSFIHHTGKDSAKGARGSSALRAAVDTEILIEGQTGTRTATVTKQRDLESGQSFAFDLQSVVIGSDEDGDITSCIVKHVEDSPAINRRAPTSKNTSIAYAVLSSLGPEVITLGAIREALRSTLPDRRRRDETIHWLQANGWLTATIGGLRVEK